jgi:hypothetical protein
MMDADASPAGAADGAEDQDDDQGGAELERGSSASSRANLRPWTKGDPRAIAAARAGGKARAARAAQRRLAAMEPAAALEQVVDRFSRDQLGPMAAAAAMWCIGEVVSGRQKVRDPAAWVRVLVDVARLEAGEVTSATASVTVTAGDVSRALELRDAARLAIGTAMVVDDDEHQDHDDDSG